MKDENRGKVVLFLVFLGPVIAYAAGIGVTIYIVILIIQALLKYIGG